MSSRTAVRSLDLAVGRDGDERRVGFIKKPTRKTP
jgi:hypothetical protein